MVNWDFIGSLEGRAFVGYVPNPEDSKSGVTIATGVDLGSWELEDLFRVSAALRPQLRPYIGLKGMTAKDALFAASPRLTITRAEADELDALTRAQELVDLSSTYDRASLIEFSALPDRAQTVIASVAFQYGYIKLRAPRFWDYVVKQDWTSAYNELLDFGDDYPTRHRMEAAYLRPLITPAPVIA